MSIGLGCDNAFCGAYWQAQGLEIGGIYPICRPETFRPVSDWSISGIPDSAHENNRHEQEITGRCIQHMGKTFQAVISEWIVKFDSREIVFDTVV
ncbi:hypothetical protein Taro_042781 [Colocasia esculenta]|uniref:E3 ubiquitin-protein ligase CHFR cysteine rich domain-containing protein n=1 Tax=Colocasia esculenta TaxID=4460 RepID=A0A843WTS7_COLES|nr:hypothetical protein [Colocasia esculenta]